MIGLQRIVDELASRIGRGVDVEDRNFQLLTHSAHVGPMDAVRRETILARCAAPAVAAWLTAAGVRAARGPIRVAANPEVGGWARLCVPLREGPHLLGFLWLLDEPRIDAAELRAVDAVVPELTAALARLAAEDDEEQRSDVEALAALLGDDPVARDAAVSALADRGRLPASGPVTAVATPDRATAAAIGRRLPVGCSLVGDAGLLLVVGAPVRPAEVAASLVSGAVAGIGGPVPALADAAEARDQAELARWVAGRRTSTGRVAVHHELGALGLLAGIARHGATPVVAELVALDAAHDAAELTQTLLTFLDAAGDATRAAADLHVHRATLHRRLKRIETITGADLADGRTRTSLHVGLLLSGLRDEGRGHLG